jgi:hypothetical protein
MVETLLADGIVSGAGEKLAAFVVKCLAVGGGFLAGYFLGGVGAWALDRWVFAQKAPAQLKKIVSLAAGAALALVVALIVFGEGGDGLFGGRGSPGEGKGASPQDDKGKATPAAPVTTPKKDDTPPKRDDEPKTQDVVPTPGDVRVTILPDDEVSEGRFYLIDGDPVPKDLAEFKRALTARRREAKPELKQIIFRFQKTRYSQSNPVVRDVVSWLNEVNIGLVFEKSG